MKEIWKDINGYENLYQISNLGNIKSFKRYRNGKLLSPSKDKDGYLQIGLRSNSGERKWYRIHRLVATAFISNPNNLKYINHKDNNPSNNIASNLEWCSMEYNNRYRFINGYDVCRGEQHISSKLTETQVKEIHKLLDEGLISQKAIGELFGVSRGCISEIKLKNTWKHIEVLND